MGDIAKLSFLAAHAWADR